MIADPVASSGVIKVPFTLGSVHCDEGAGETDKVAEEVVGLPLLLLLPLFGADMHAVGGNVTVAAVVPFALELFRVRES